MRLRKTKIGTEVAHVTCESDTSFKVKGLQVWGILWRPLAQLVCPFLFKITQKLFADLNEIFWVDRLRPGKID